MCVCNRETASDLYIFLTEIYIGLSDISAVTIGLLQLGMSVWNPMHTGTSSFKWFIYQYMQNYAIALFHAVLSKWSAMLYVYGRQKSGGKRIIYTYLMLVDGAGILTYYHPVAWCLN